MAAAALEGLTLEAFVGYLFWPLAWAMGVPAAECSVVGELLGIKTILNEFFAYFQFKEVAAGFSYRSMVITTYALCGFANFGSLGIMIGGLGGMVPERRADIVSLGLKSIVAGTLATCMTATVVGLL